MSRFQRIRLTLDGPVATIVLDRPPVNVLDLLAIREINLALDSLRGREEIAVLAFRGAGEKAFSAGVDIRDHTPDKVEEMIAEFHHVFRRLSRSTRVTAAIVQGHCLGGGCELATFCDLVLASESAKFGQPEINVGCFPPVAAAYLPSVIGDRRAAEFVLLGNTISAAEARQWGLVNWVVPDAELESAGAAFLQALRAKSPVVLRLTKEALRRGRSLEFESTLQHVEELYLEKLTRTEDMAEGVNAFMEKRAPAWKGR